MTTFTYAHAASESWQRATASCIEQLGTKKANLGFVYLTDPYRPHFAQIVAQLRQNTGIEDWVGTIGLGILCTGTEYYEQPAMVALTCDLPAQQYRLIEPIDSDLTHFSQQNQTWIDETQAMVGVVHADPHDPHTPKLVHELARQLNHGFLIGGLGSAQSGNPHVSKQVFDGGMSGALLAGDVTVATGLTQGCSPLAATHEITACQGNVLISLDDRPALDVLKEDIGELLARDLQQVGGYIFAGLPIAGSDTGDYLVRNLLGLDQERKLLAIGDRLEVGQSLMFCRRDAATAREDLRRMLDELSARCERPKGGLYFSCLARGRHMFGDDSAELRLIQQTLGDVPLAGFFANGEICHDRLYGYTGVLTLFS